ncbi:homeobox protein 13 [Drosophila suzukii]|uniref:Homeobox protein 13 n=1 Tax=Drosophila suzukii TaxID=28584 RepID=A0AB39ZSP4_DROSZ
MPSVKSAESEILLGIIRSDSMTNGNSLRSCLLLATILGLLCRTKALPFEYVDEHEDFNYDLDTAQSQAKYDARLLSQQMLSDAELQRQGVSGGQDNALDADSSRAQGIAAGSDLEAASSAQENLEPHSRAASCFTNGHKYTHGQKVPRLDACEVCLCMDGEIFCWWEKCDKANVNKAKSGGSHNVNVGLGLGNGNGDGVGGGGGDDDDGDGDYSDPYRQESTTGKSTKVHKAARKVGKRHKHRRNQKNFNDYEVYHSQRQKQKQKLKPRQPDYKKSVIKQQLQLQQKHKSDVGGNYNIIKEHKHEQQQQQQQQQNVAALAVNQAAKATHYQQPASTTPPHPQQHNNNHPHQQPPHSSSKILNFPENLPALLYYDYKTEEHEHHQHQHHQQHLLHEKQRLLQQQQQEALARQKAAESHSQSESAAGEPSASADKNFDEAETDSDILPEPPTKQPRASATQWPTSSSTAKALMTTRPVATVAATSTSTSTAASASATRTTTSRTTPRTTTTTATGTNEMVTSTLSGMEKSGATVAATNLQHDRSGPDAEPDDAFHRWLTSTELNADNTNSLDDNLEQETPASTIIDDVGTANKSDRSSSGSKDNAGDAVFFRSSYNDYSSEFNGSVVNIDITLTAVDVHPRRQTDLIANGNRTSGVNDNGNSNISNSSKSSKTNIYSNDGAAGTTMDRQAPRSIGTIGSSGSNQDQPQQSPVVPSYTLTTIITTTPLAPGRMCNVLGKLYKIGDILPQDTGNCLQCICTDAVTPDEMPSVTCSPHNCPPLVLPDLFDATGY